MKKILTILGLLLFPTLVFGALTTVPWYYNTTNGNTYTYPSINQNIGIGTTSPYAKLSVVGEVVGAYFTATTTATSTLTGGLQTNLLKVTSTTASSTFANGIELTKGCVKVGGSCLGSGGGGSGTVNVGFPGTFGVYLAHSDTISYSQFAEYSDTTGAVGFYSGDGLSNVFINSSSGYGLKVQGNNKFYSGNTNFGNNDAPTNNLSVIADPYYSPYNSSIFKVSSSTLAWATTTIFTVNANNRVGIGTTTPWAKLSINPVATDNSAPAFAIGSSTATNFVVTNAGMVGVGTTTPSGNFTIQATSNGNAFLIASSTNGSTVATINNLGEFTSGYSGISNGKLTLNSSISSSYYTSFVQNGSAFSITTTNTDLNLVSGARSSWSVSGGGWSSGLPITAASSFTWTGGPSFVPMTATFSNTAGQTKGLALNLTYNQSGSTAANTDLFINRVQSNLGTGAQYLIDTQVGGVSKFNISNTGKGYFADNLGIGTTTPSTNLQVNNTTATSTISATVINGSTRSTTLGGKIILQDMNGGTCTEITTQSGVISSKAVTCP